MRSARCTYRPLAIPFQQRSSPAVLMAIFSLHSVPGRLIQKSWASRSWALASETCGAAVRPLDGPAHSALPAPCPPRVWQLGATHQLFQHACGWLLLQS